MYADLLYALFLFPRRGSDGPFFVYRQSGDLYATVDRGEAPQTPEARSHGSAPRGIGTRSQSQILDYRKC